MKKNASCTLLSLICALSACSSSEENGTISFTSWGEEYIEKEIPASSVADGWTIHYNKFLVNFTAITVADASGAVAGKQTGSKLVNHVTPGVKPLLTLRNVTAKAWTHVSYELAPATQDADASLVTEADKALMVQGGYSVYVDAVATKGTVSKKYAWGFRTHTLFDRCKGELSGKDTDGSVVTNGGTDTIELTIHGDHLYYDDLQAPEAKVRFDAIASADANNDGTVTLEELAQVKRATIATAEAPYGVGSAAGINDLGAFVTALSRTVGHFRGEGECFASAK